MTAIITAMMPLLSARYHLSPDQVRALTVGELKAYMEGLKDG